MGLVEGGFPLPSAFSPAPNNFRVGVVRTIGFVLLEKTFFFVSPLSGSADRWDSFLVEPLALPFGWVPSGACTLHWVAARSASLVPPARPWTPFF